MGVYDTIKGGFGDYDLGYNLAHAAYTPNATPGAGRAHGPQLANGQPLPPAAPGTGGKPSVTPTGQPIATGGAGTARNGPTPAYTNPVAQRRAPDPGHGNGQPLTRSGATPGSVWGTGSANPAPTAPPASPYGTQSGPGILENWFNQRAGGTDPAYEYAMKRGMESLGNQSAAAGSFNSGAARQQESDFAANMGAQRLGQLDALAGGASGEHQNRLNSMFSQGLGLAGGESGINSAYDLAAGKAKSDALSALLGYTTNKAGVDDKSRQQGWNNIIGGIAAL